jgi:hypothetical protein
MPEPWPACPRPASENKTILPPRRFAAGRFFRVPTRFAVAAAVALLVIGYLGLQNWFPDPRPVSPSPLDGKGEIGHVPKLLHPGRSIERTKSGRPAALEVQKTEDPNKWKLNVFELPAKK